MDSDRDRFVDMQSNGGNATGFYGDKHINALLTMMQEKDYGRVLAKPKILVNDNEAGTISTIDRTYVTKTSSIPVSGGGAGNDATLIQTAVDYADYPAGITLEIVPHISRGDFLRLDITLDRSDFGTITGDKPPDTTESNIKTTVTVPDQSTIILGGLLKLNQSKGGTKVPILGDIPLLGGLFRSASNSDIQRNLYVFVKAEIIEPENMGLAQGGLHSISERNRDAFEKHENEFQEYNDWPGITPKKMDPINVLDAQ
jgi:general secretion pathway protein D